MDNDVKYIYNGIYVRAIVYRRNVVLLTDVYYLFVCYNTSGRKTPNVKLIKLISRPTVHFPKTDCTPYG